MQNNGQNCNDCGLPGEPVPGQEDVYAWVPPMPPDEALTVLSDAGARPSGNVFAASQSRVQLLPGIPPMDGQATLVTTEPRKATPATQMAYIEGMVQEAISGGTPDATVEYLPRLGAPWFQPLAVQDAGDDEDAAETKGGPHAIPDEVYKPKHGQTPDTKWENPAPGTRVKEGHSTRYKVPKPEGPAIDLDGGKAAVAEVLEDYRKGRHASPPPEPRRLPCPNSKMRYFVGIYWWEKSVAAEIWQDASKTGDDDARKAANAAVDAVERGEELDKAEADDVPQKQLIRYMQDSLAWRCDKPCELTTNIRYMSLELSVRSSIELLNDPASNRLYYKVWLVRLYKLDVLADFWCATP